jgi:hypothetical protein
VAHHPIRSRSPTAEGEIRGIRGFSCVGSVHQAYGATGPGHSAAAPTKRSTRTQSQGHVLNAMPPAPGGSSASHPSRRSYRQPRGSTRQWRDRARSLISNARCLTGFDRLPMPRGLRFAHLRFTAHHAFRVSPVRLRVAARREVSALTT